MGFDSVTPLVPQAASSVFFLVGGAGPIPAMAYESIPAAEDGLLLKTPKPKTTSLKSLVACAAIASFVLGIVAATAVTQHAIARQTNLKTTAAGLVNRAYSSPTSEEYCGGQWGFALAFGRKDAKNQCPPGESASPPLSLSLSLCVCLYPIATVSFWCAGSQCDKTSNTCVPSVPKTTGVPGVVGSIANQVSARATRRVKALEERRR